MDKTVAFHAGAWPWAAAAGSRKERGSLFPSWIHLWTPSSGCPSSERNELVVCFCRVILLFGLFLPQATRARPSWCLFTGFRPCEVRALLHAYLKDHSLAGTVSHSHAFISPKYSLKRRMSGLRGLSVFHAKKVCQVAFPKSVWKKSCISLPFCCPPGKNGVSCCCNLHFHDY